jgi:hypothetical protein
MAQQEPTIGVFFANMLTVYYHARFDQTSASKFVRYVHNGIEVVSTPMPACALSHYIWNCARVLINRFPCVSIYEPRSNRVSDACIRFVNMQKTDSARYRVLVC